MTLTHPSPNHSRRMRAVEMVVVHWTGGSYASAVDWCQRAESQVSYHAIIAPTGETATLVPWDRSAWSVGKSKARDKRFTWGTSGNSASDNIALAGGPPTKPTKAALTALAQLVRARFAARGWPTSETWRIVGHADVCVPVGRKTDPEGQGWMSLDSLRAAVMT